MRIFLSGVTPSSDAVRTVVRDSWARSMHNGVDPGIASPDDPRVMSHPEFIEYRAAHPITAVLPLVQSLMLDDIADSGVLVALTDEVGELLWVEGSSEARDKATASTSLRARCGARTSSAPTRPGWRWPSTAGCG